MDAHEQFERSFSMHVAGFVADCECGRVFWDSVNTGYDVSDEERDALDEDPKATAVPHGVERIVLEGKIYCMDCNCWHARAERIEEWLREHKQSIAEWFRLEKKRLQSEAAAVPEIVA